MPQYGVQSVRLDMVLAPRLQVASLLCLRIGEDRAGNQRQLVRSMLVFAGVPAAPVGSTAPAQTGDWCAEQLWPGKISECPAQSRLVFRKW